MTDDLNPIPDDDGLPAEAEAVEPPESPDAERWPDGSGAWGSETDDLVASADPDVGGVPVDPPDDGTAPVTAYADGDEPTPSDEPLEGEPADPLGDAVATMLNHAPADHAWHSVGAVTGWTGTAVAPEPAATAWAVEVENPDPHYVDPDLLRP